METLSSGQKIRKYRRELDLTQQELGAKAGINFRNLPHYETGRLKPGLKVLSRLAAALNVQVEDLLDDSLDQEQPVKLRDPDLLRYFRQLEEMSDEDQRTVKHVLQALVIKHQVQQLGKVAS